MYYNHGLFYNVNSLIFRSTDPRVTIDISEWILVHRDETFLLQLDFRFLPLSLWTLGPNVRLQAEGEGEEEEEKRWKEEEGVAEANVELDTGKVVISEKSRQKMVNR